MIICPNCFIQNKDSSDRCYGCNHQLHKINKEHFEDYIIEPDNSEKDILSRKNEVILDFSKKSKKSYKFDVENTDGENPENFFNKDDASIFTAKDSFNIDTNAINSMVNNSLQEEISLIHDDLVEETSIPIEGELFNSINNSIEEKTEMLDDDMIIDNDELFPQNTDSLEEKTEILDDVLDDMMIESEELDDSDIINDLEKDLNLSILDKIEEGSEFLGMNVKKILGISVTGISILVEDESFLMVYRLIDSKYYNSYESFYKHVASYQNIERENSYQIFDFGKKDDFYYILTSYTEGVSLKNILTSKIQQQKVFSLEQSVAILLQLIAQLDHVKDKISHKFITPESIIIDKNANVTLIDFGIYHSITPATRFKLSTAKGAYTDFIAPELMNMKDTNPILADIYSLGVVFYNLLTGKTPQTEFKLPIVANQKKAEQLSIFFDSCFHPNPEKRFQDFSILKTILLTLTEDEKPLVEKGKNNEITVPPAMKKLPPKKKIPPTFKPPTFKPASIKDSKLNLPTKENINEFDIYKNKKGDITLGELDDVERWFFVRDGIDYGPISAKKIRELVEAKELLPSSMVKTLTHPIKKGKIEEIDLFQNFLKDFSLKESEKELQKKMESFKKKKTLYTIIAAIVIISIGAVIFYINSRPKEKRFHKRTEQEILIEGQKVKAEKERLAKEQAIKDKKMEEEIKKEIEDEVQEEIALKTNKVKPKDKEIVKEKNEKRKTRIKKKGTKYYKKYLALKKKKEEELKKKEEETKKLLAEQERDAAFKSNKKKNEDISSISFNGKGSGKDLSNQEIKNKLNRKKSNIINCFVQEYNRGNDLPGKLTISYSVRQDGRFYGVTIQHPKYKNKKGKLNYCILKVFRSITFEPFSGGTKVGRMPLEFEFD